MLRAMSPLESGFKRKEGVLQGGKAERHGDAIHHGVYRLVIVDGMQGHDEDDRDLEDLFNSGPQDIAGVRSEYILAT